MSLTFLHVSISVTTGVGFLLLLQRAHNMVDADRCTFFIANHTAHELWAMQGEVDIRVPMDKGLVGVVAMSKKTLNIPDAYQVCVVV